MRFTSKEIYTKSNVLSFVRFLLVIPFWILFDNYDSHSVRNILFVLCLFAALTDFLDGYLARKFNEVTEFGKIIDPLADKALMAVIVLKLFLIGEISAFYFFTIIIRDLLIFTGGIYVTKKIGKVLPSNKLGKIAVFNIGIVILLILTGLSKESIISLIFYYSSLTLIFASFSAYLIRASEFIISGNKV